MKKIFFTLFLLLALTVHASTYYGFKIGGVSVNSDNYTNVKGSNIKANDTSQPYSVVYNPSTKTVTLNNVKIERTGSGNRCILNESCDGLTVMFEGNNTYFSSTTCAPIRAEANTTFTCSELIQVSVYGKDGDANCLYVTDGATVTFDHATFFMSLTGNSNPAISASSTTNETIIFHHSRISAKSENSSTLTRFAKVKSEGSVVVLRTGSETATAVSNVKDFYIMSYPNLIVGYSNSITSFTNFTYSGTATFSTSKQTFVNSDNNTLPGEGIIISQRIPINETNFPDANFRTWLTNKYGTNLETYEIFEMRTINVEHSANASLKNVEDWTGIKFFHCFRRLWNQGGRTRVLRMASSEFYHLRCYENPVGIIWNHVISTLPLLAPSGKEAIIEGFNAVATERNPIPRRDQMGYLKSKKFDFIVKNGDQTFSLNALQDYWPIDYDHFPDDAFRTHLYSTAEGLDAVIYESENAKIYSFDLKNKKIADLTGIEGFTNITKLYCNQNKLSTLNLSKNTKLTLLYCYWNKIKSTGWDEFIDTAPSFSTRLDVYCYYPSSMEQNDPPTHEQVARAKTKKIHFFQFINYVWEEMSDTPPVVPGDVNGDGECTASDVTALYNKILYNDSSKVVNGDQNGDGAITASDVTAVYNIILGI